jgi:hypothetical protein
MRKKLHRPQHAGTVYERPALRSDRKGPIAKRSQPDPSVACLLDLAADQIVMRAMSGTMLKATKVPLPARLDAADRAGSKDRGGDRLQPARQQTGSN